MYGSYRVLLQVLSAHLLCVLVLGSELTFELPDNAKQCFYEDIIIGTKCTLEFQVRPKAQPSVQSVLLKAISRIKY